MRRDTGAPPARRGDGKLTANGKDTPFEPERISARAIDWDHFHADFIMVRGSDRRSDTEYMAATDQTPENHNPLTTQEPSIHGSRPRRTKAAGIRADRFDPGLKRTYAEMAVHYGTAILPARPRKPRE